MASVPHIVFITTDTQGRDMVSAYGRRGGVDTPHLDAFAERAVLFENACCASPVCTPARGSWYSGRPPSRHGAWTNNTSPARDVPLLAEILKTKGYRPVHLGKWHLIEGAYEGRTEPDGGFEAPWYEAANFHKDFPGEGPNKFGAWNRGLEAANFCFGHQVAERAIEVMQNPGGKPLFLAVEFDEPHGPYICPPPFRGRFGYDEIYRPATLNAPMDDKPRLQQEYAAFLRAGRENPEELPAYYRHYHDCNSYVDHEIGRVLAAVERHLGGNTVVLFTSDHGDHHGAFGLCAKGPTMYESTTAVPLIIRAPDAKTGQRIGGLASGLDIFPTLLDYAGVDTLPYETASGYAGLSLRECLKTGAPPDREAVFMEYHRFGLGNAQVDGFFPIRCVRTTRWKLSINLFDKDELYDLADDPEESRNLIDDPSSSAIRDELHDRILEHQEAIRDPFRSPQWKLRPWRTGATHRFEGLFTTGYKEDWAGTMDFHSPR